MADMTLSINDSVKMSEGCSHPDISRSLSDTVSPSGQTPGHYGDISASKTVVENLSASDNPPSKTEFSPKDISESISFADQKDNQVISDPEFIQPVAISETINGAVMDNKTTSESASLSSSIRESAALSISSPEIGASFVHGDTVVFSGVAMNLLTGADISDSLLKWVSNIDGMLGYGSNFSCKTLSVGTHNVSFAAEGHAGIKFRTVVVTGDSAPSRPENLSEE